MGQQFDNSILHLAKRKGFYPYKYMGDFEIALVFHSNEKLTRLKKSSIIHRFI